MADDWIQGAIKHPGALRNTAREEGGMSEDGKIKRSWLEEKAKGSDRTARRARLALELRGFHHKKKGDKEDG